MLATGGLLGLLLMGAAVGGLVTGMDAGRDDDDLGEDVDTDTEGETAALEASAYEDVPRIPLADWLAEIGEETAHRGDSGVSNVLYARAVPWDAYNPVDESRVPGIQNTPDGAEIHDASQTHVDALRPEEALPEAMADAAATSSPHLHIVETITFGAGPEIPLVTEFDPHTDRLILDFPGGAGDSPVIGVDLDLSPGDALVLADGVPVTFVAGAATLSPAQIDIVMTGEADPAEKSSEVEGGAAIGSYEALGVIRDFNPSTQQIEIDYDPAVFAEPEVAIEASEDGSGADILLNGEVILSVAGVRDLDPELVVLRPV
jgi:hypothetical protein